MPLVLEASIAMDVWQRRVMESIVRCSARGRWLSTTHEPLCAIVYFRRTSCQEEMVYRTYLQPKPPQMAHLVLPTGLATARWSARAALH